MADYSGFPENETDKVFIILDKMDKIGLDGVREELLAEGYAPEAVEKYTGLLAEIQNDAAGVRALGEKLSGVMDPAKAENLATIMETVKAVADIEFVLNLTRRWCAAWATIPERFLRFPWKASAAPLQAADVTTS